MDGAPAADGSDARQRRPAPIDLAAPSSAAAAADEDDLFSPTANFPLDVSLFPGQSRSLSGIALRGFALGAGLALCTLLALLLVLQPRLPPVLVAPSVAALLAPLWRLPFFGAALAAFHFLEFYSTALSNTPAATIDSFLLTANWPAYAIAHAAASLECLLRYTLFRRRWFAVPLPAAWSAAWSAVLPLSPAALYLLAGFAVVVAGQTVRTAAMVHAGRSFNHQIQRRRARSHALITTGIYAHLRHPSYFGFFWWAIGTQLVLGNVICLFGYAAVLGRFFSIRIRHEEKLLVRFFGKEYEDYRERVGTKMPFI